MLPKFPAEIPPTCRKIGLVCKKTRIVGCRVQKVRALDARICCLRGWKIKKNFLHLLFLFFFLFNLSLPLRRAMQSSPPAFLV